MNKIHKILSYECKDLSILTHQLNKDIDNYDNWKTDLRIDANRESGCYFYILTVYK